LRGPGPVERVSPSQSSRTATAQSQTLLRARSDRPQLARRPLLPDRLIPSPNLDPIPRLSQTARTRRGSLFSDVLPCLPQGRAPLAPARPRRSVPFDGSFRDRRQRFRRTLPALSQHSPSAGPFPNEIGRVTSAIADERVPTARHPRASLRPTAVGMTRQLGHPPSARDTAPHRMSRAVFFGLRIRTTPRRPKRQGLRARLPAPQRALPSCLVGPKRPAGPTPSNRGGYSSCLLPGRVHSHISTASVRARLPAPRRALPSCSDSRVGPSHRAGRHCRACGQTLLRARSDRPQLARRPLLASPGCRARLPTMRIRPTRHCGPQPAGSAKPAR